MTSLFLGAPLLPGEAGRGTLRFGWTQGVSRRRWLAAQVAPVAIALGLAGAGIGLLFGWCSAPFVNFGRLPAGLPFGLKSAAFRRPPRRGDLIWAWWRQHRLAISIMLAGFAASALLLGAFELWIQLSHIVWVVSLLPWIVGVFVGAPLVAREFETGSYRFAMTQGVSWRRQVTTKLLLFAGLILVGSCGLSGLAIWWKNPSLTTGPYTGISYWSAGYFGDTPVVLPATALTTGFGVTYVGSLPYGPLGAALLKVDTATMRGQSNEWGGPLAPAVGRYGTRVVESSGGAWRGSLLGQRTYYYPAGMSGTHGTIWVEGWFAGPRGQLSARVTQLMFRQLNRPLLAWTGLS